LQFCRGGGAGETVATPAQKSGQPAKSCIRTGLWFLWANLTPFSLRRFLWASRYGDR
jgi:hypothetical protein